MIGRAMRGGAQEESVLRPCRRRERPVCETPRASVRRALAQGRRAGLTPIEGRKQHEQGNSAAWRLARAPRRAATLSSCRLGHGTTVCLRALGGARPRCVCAAATPALHFAPRGADPLAAARLDVCEPGGGVDGVYWRMLGVWGLGVARAARWAGRYSGAGLGGVCSPLPNTPRRRLAAAARSTAARAQTATKRWFVQVGLCVCRPGGSKTRGGHPKAETDTRASWRARRSIFFAAARRRRATLSVAHARLGHRFQLNPLHVPPHRRRLRGDTGQNAAARIWRHGARRL